MGSKSSGKAPSYTPQELQDVINQQTGSNLATAQAQSVLNNANQQTPYGSVTYTQPGGANTQWNVSTQLSPAEQNLLNLSQQAQTTYGNIGNAQLSAAAPSLSTPINTNYSDVRNQYIQSQMGLLQPQLAQSQQALQSQLQNQGVAQGSDAWNNAMRSYNNQVSSAYANILANAQTGVGQAISQQESLRDQPINEAQALLTGSQIQQPNVQQVAQTSVSPTNVTGVYTDYMQNQMNAYDQNVAQSSSALGGIGSLVGTLGGASMMGGTGGFSTSALGMALGASDRRLKTDERTVGKLMMPSGELPIKTFRFKGDPVRRMGFIAQDVEKHDPHAVITHPVTGVKSLNYARVLLGAHHHAMRGGRGVGSAA